MPDSRQFSTAQAYQKESQRSFWFTSPLLLLLSSAALYGFAVASGLVAFLCSALALLFLALAVSLPLVSAKEFRECVFEINDEYVRVQHPYRATRMLRWADVTRLSCVPGSRAILLSGAAAKDWLVIPCQSDGITEILDYIFGKTGHLNAAIPLPVTFQKETPSLRSVVFAGLWLACCVPASTFLFDKNIDEIIDLVILATLLYVPFILYPYYKNRTLTGQRLTVDATGFETHQRSRPVRIHFQDVASIAFVPKAKFQGCDVVVRLTNGETLSPCPPDCNLFEVYRALRTGWERSRKP